MIASTKTVAQATATDFESPSQFCDVVMKGGITSGIVYPPAILRIAQRFSLRSIGGTSAGAISAAVAAAAEFRRQSGGSGDGFLKLKTGIMDWLAQGRNLQSLFVPALTAAPVFYFFMWLVEVKSAMRRTSLIGICNVALALVVVAFFLLGYFQALLRFHVPWLGSAPQVFTMAVVLLLAVAAAMVLYVLPSTNYGMCTGGRKSTVPSRAQPLTFWLSQKIDDIAGTGADRPLTFGDLSSAGINLQMVTTCVTMGRPFRLPFEYDLFYFRRDELERYFPEYVVRWMVEHGREPNPGDPTSPARRAYLKRKDYLPLPAPADLPVIVATRMSLSFPLLLSAIRLYAVDYTLPANAANPAAPTIEPVWFSDGGLSSNFPIALFDAPIPRWPTLAITLEAFPPGVDASNPANGAYVPINNRAEIGSTWSRFSQNRCPANTPGFYGAIFNSMQNWQDTMQSEAPGFRDRIAHVRLSDEEGGLNLTMPPGVIRTLLERGELAGQLLVEHFQIPEPPPPAVMTWDNHRWIRLRTTLDVLQRYAGDFRDAWQADAATTASYETLVSHGMTPPPAAYRFNSADQIGATMTVANNLVGVAAATDGVTTSLSAGAPKPVSDLHARPRF
ncbi:MAG: patatin-like phospholipase family protein [Candidatus Eremiobacteraeota bacterium]|nr:patatin-like phospholipase family protein [Candidatus Eremiobacteraeota bacterium]